MISRLYPFYLSCCAYMVACVVDTIRKRSQCGLFLSAWQYPVLWFSARLFRPLVSFILLFSWTIAISFRFFLWKEGTIVFSAFFVTKYECWDVYLSGVPSFMLAMSLLFFRVCRIRKWILIELILWIPAILPFVAIQWAIRSLAECVSVNYDKLTVTMNAYDRRKSWRMKKSMNFQGEPLKFFEQKSAILLLFLLLNLFLYHLISSKCASALLQKERNFARCAFFLFE